MKRLLIFLLVIGAAATAFAGAGAVRKIGWVTPSGSAFAYLGLPRYLCGIKGDTIFVVPTQNGTNQTGYAFSTDQGQTWTEVKTPMGYSSSGIRTWYPGDHTSMWFDGGLHVMGRNFPGYPAYYKYRYAPYAAADTEMVDFIYPNCYYPIVMASGADDVWFLNLAEDTASTGFLLVEHTTDRWTLAENTTAYNVCKPACNTTVQNALRVGMVRDTNGYPVIIGFLGSTADASKRGLYRYKFNGTDFDSVPVLLGSSFGMGDRYTSQAQVNGKSHFAYADDSEGKIIHLFETSEGVFDSTIATDYVGSRGGSSPCLSVYGESPHQVLYMGVCSMGGLAVGDSTVYVLRWDGSDWTDSVGITPGAGWAGNCLTMPPETPGSWDSIPVFIHNRGRDDSVGVVMFSAYVEPGLIRSLPYTITMDTVALYGDTFHLATNLEYVSQPSNSAALTLTSLTGGVVVDLDGYTLGWGASAADSTTGIYANGCTDLTIKGGTVDPNIANSTPVYRYRSIWLNNCNHAIVDSMTVYIRGYASSRVTSSTAGTDGIYIGGSLTVGDTVRNSTIRHCGSGYYQRSYWPAENIIVSRGMNDALITDSTIYHVAVVNCVLDSIIQSGIFFYGEEGTATRGHFLTEDCRFTMDVHNDGPYTGYQCGESYAIATRGVERVVVRNCVINSGTGSFGGNGVFIERTGKQDLAWDWEISGNLMNLNSGPAVSHTTGIRLRTLSHGGQIYDNDITCTYDTNTSTAYMTNEGACIWDGFGEGTAANSCYDLTVYNNTLRDSCGPGVTTAFGYTMHSKCSGCALTWYGNKVYSNGYFGWLGEDDQYDLVIDRDTLIKFTPVTTPNSWYIGDWINPLADIYMSVHLRDCFYQGNTSLRPDTLLGYYNNTEPTTTWDYSLRHERTCSLYVAGTGTGLLPVVGAPVVFVNAYGDTTLAGVTDSGGLVTGIVTYRWDHQSGYSEGGALDSTGYNDHTLWGKLGTDSLSSALTVGWPATGYADTVWLPVTGTGVWGSTGEPPVATDTDTLWISGHFWMQGDTWIQGR